MDFIGNGGYNGRGFILNDFDITTDYERVKKGLSQANIFNKYLFLVNAFYRPRS